MDTWAFVIVVSVLFCVFEIFPDLLNKINICWKKENWGPNKLNDMTKFTYVVNGRADTGSQSSWLLDWLSGHYIMLAPLSRVHLTEETMMEVSFVSFTMHSYHPKHLKSKRSNWAINIKPLRQHYFITGIMLQEKNSHTIVLTAKCSGTQQFGGSNCWLRSCPEAPKKVGRHFFV